VQHSPDESHAAPKDLATAAQLAAQAAGAFFRRTLHAPPARERCARVHPAASWIAGVYVWGTVNSNECPTGSTRIDGSVACQIAAAATRKSWRSSVGYSDRPRGCYVWDGDGASVYLNTHATGASSSVARLLCAGMVRSGAAACEPRRSDVATPR
jgi:hypothetical protein